jgi:UPF0755 protein
MAKKVILLLVAAILAVAIYISLYFNTTIKTKQNLKLPSANSAKIVKYLQDKNYTVGFLDRVFLNLLTKPKEGWIYINKKELARYKFLKQIGSYANHYTPITIIPGETTYNIIKHLNSKLNLNSNKLLQSYKTLATYKEGNFIANTYNIPIYFKEKDTIKFLVDTSTKSYKKISAKYFKNFNKQEWKKIIIVASIIEKEAANKEEMPLIASVIYNRLKKKMRLQMDGTLNYGKYSHKKVTPQRIKNDKSSYNTYKFKGLPKEPICNVSTSSIRAAIKPADTKYLYFMKNSKGTHNFTSEYKSHIQNIKKRKKELKAPLKNK